MSEKQFSYRRVGGQSYSLSDALELSRRDDLDEWLLARLVQIASGSTATAHRAV